MPSDLIDTFLKDGDEIVLEGWCKDSVTNNIILGFGECKGKVLSARVGEEDTFYSSSIYPTL